MSNIELSGQAIEDSLAVLRPIEEGKAFTLSTLVGHYRKHESVTPEYLMGLLSAKKRESNAGLIYGAWYHIKSKIDPRKVMSNLGVINKGYRTIGVKSNEAEMLREINAHKRSQRDLADKNHEANVAGGVYTYELASKIASTVEAIEKESLIFSPEGVASIENSILALQSMLESAQVVSKEEVLVY